MEYSLPCPNCKRPRILKKVAYDRAVKHNKLCRSCTQSILHGGDGVYHDGKRRCFICKELKDAEFFSSKLYGNSSYCKDCEQKRNIEYHRNSVVKTKRRIKMYKPKTIAERLIIMNYDNPCAICGNKEAGHLDHDHITGRIRGYLCGSCNRALGLFKDDPDLLIKASEYINKWKV